MLILARYGELGLKSPKVKKKFEKKLVENLKRQLNELNCSVKCEFSRIYIDYKINTEKIIEKIKKTPGIVSFSVCKKTTIDLEDLFKVCYKFVIEKKPKTFGLKVTRAGTHEFSSRDIAIKLGDLIRTKLNLKVDLTNPDLWINIEIRNKESFIFTEKISCIGGLPVGIEGNIFSLLETKFDIYSSILMMKRGCRIYPISFKYISRRQKKFVEILKEFDPDIKVVESKRKDLGNLINLLEIKALVSGKTIEDLETVESEEFSPLPYLYPNCSLTKKEVLEEFQALL